MSLAIVTLSRQLASGGNSIACGVAQVLGLRVVDLGVINQAAAEAGIPQITIEELGYEGRRGLVERILRVVYEMPAVPTTLEPSSRDATAASTIFDSFLSPLYRPMSVSMREYAQIADMVIRDLAREGNIIVVGRAGQVVLKDVPGVLHVRIIASLDRRVAVLMEREGIDRRQATARLRASDRARADYLQRYHGANWADTILYDLVINTDHLAPSVIIATVVGACRALDEQGGDAAPSEDMS